MDGITLSERLEEVTTRIIVDKQSGLTEGSGVVISEDGLVMTASHVIMEDSQNVAGEILVRKKATDFIKYKPIIGGLEVDADYLSKPIIIDLALLKPLEEITSSYLEIADSVSVGMDCLMAGFPQEMTHPFNFAQKMDWDRISMKGGSEFDFYDSSKQILIKRAMIGQTQHFTLSGEYDTAILYMDTNMSPGASGGPVINDEGKLVGITTELLAMTIDQEQWDDPIKVPSGTGLALGPKGAMQYFEEIESP